MEHTTDNPYIQQLVNVEKSVFVLHISLLETFFTDPVIAHNPVLANSLVQLLTLAEKRARRGHDFSPNNIAYSVMESYRHSDQKNKADILVLLADKSTREVITSMMLNFVQIAFDLY